MPNRLHMWIGLIDPLSIASSTSGHYPLPFNSGNSYSRHPGTSATSMYSCPFSASAGPQISRLTGRAPPVLISAPNGNVASIPTTDPVCWSSGSERSTEESSVQAFASVQRGGDPAR